MGCGGSSDSGNEEPTEEQQVGVGVTGDGVAQAVPNIQPFTSLKVVPISGGDGSTYPNQGDELTMHYVGTNHGGPNHGKMFDSSRMKGRPFKFQIGMGQVIKGWDEGVIQLSLGQKANLEIPYSLGYGEAGAGGAIAPCQDLLFEVELLAIN
mmetsp:Transcript_33263/g.29145  ORF Transcript_33263/g.29145 Transcript_33263/m.29145 type:complete len:152 (-) Transcript_33263:109-564(-)|eukprot:CAMPEP_0201581098 /NCGR_PEP_ID=MMETSP0190_2-20130828/62733_1 /ASSEMBLY_ACC=CAM_ASM_000263 /TAXON_ID=37353 /ORGANISM="Rosalina sp." /LENGTH=151 /DNA_ID=CAMNT_0048018377 /DNA_START=36 /DNA_END=491 /DNA_ORIENTATION=-